MPGIFAGRPILKPSTLLTAIVAGLLTVGSLLVNGDSMFLGKVAIGPTSFTPTYWLDIQGDQRISATGTEQLIYSNASGTEGLSGIRSYVALATGTINSNNFLGVIDSQNPKTAGVASIFTGQISVNGADTGGTYAVFNSGSAAASLATTTALFVGSGMDFAIDAVSGTARLGGRVTQGSGGSLASANSLTLSSYGNAFTITGATQINAIAVSGWTPGSIVILDLVGAPTVAHNTAGGAGTVPILLNGSVSWTPAGAGGLIMLYYNGTNWKEVSRLDP